MLSKLTLRSLPIVPKQSALLCLTRGAQIKASSSRKASSLNYTPASSNFLRNHSYPVQQSVPSWKREDSKHHEEQATDDSPFGYSRATFTGLGLLLATYTVASTWNEFSGSVPKANKEPSSTMQAITKATNLPAEMIPLAMASTIGSCLAMTRVMPPALASRLGLLSIPISLFSFVAFIRPHLYARCQTMPDPAVCNHTSLGLCSVVAGVGGAGAVGMFVSRLGVPAALVGFTVGASGVAVAYAGVIGCLMLHCKAELGMPISEWWPQYMPLLADSQVCNNLAVAIAATNVVAAALPVPAARLAAVVGFSYMVLCVDELSVMIDSITKDYQARQKSLERRMRRRQRAIKSEEI
eukprot:c7954_g1_i2.p1 GENE.c7954_g1_i2~~c7954_g1_i2.p1  ORF type:complete len:353 (+),score=69.34 c7954_g1_i2:74-1132(+)